jgi:hypothetical protein
MAFRSHVMRSLDVKDRSNQLILALTGLSLAVGLALVVTTDASAWMPVVAAASTFVTWALTREIDPDRAVTALLAGAFAGVWVVGGFDVALLPLVGMLAASRLLLESTGRRPLLSDLVVIAVLASAISFTPAGWATGFALALAIYVDNRLAEESTTLAMTVAIVAALGASAVASLTGAFPQEIPEINQLLTVLLGLLALLTLIREPPEPTSQVDSRRKTFLKSERLSASRVSAALILFAAALLTGEQGTGLVPAAVALALSLASSEAERIYRSR